MNTIIPKGVGFLISAMIYCSTCAPGSDRDGRPIPGEDRIGQHLTLQFESFVIHVYPIPKLRGSGMCQGADNAGWVYSWGDSERSIVVQGQSIVLNDVHHTIPQGAAEIWLINGKLVSPERGLIAPSPQPKEMADAITDRQIDFQRTVGGVEFEIEAGDSSGTGEVKSGDLIWANFGELFFGVVEGKLIFRGKDYGKIGKGDVVKVDRVRNVTIVRDSKPSSTR